MQDNLSIMRAVWVNGSNEFQQRIPEPTQANIANVIETLFDPMNKRYYNEFCDTLINRVGLTILNNKIFKNKLAAFKGEKITYGNTVQEILPAWIKAHSYDPNAVDVFKNEAPELEAFYYSQNREDYYPITINRQVLHRSFNSVNGLNTLVAAEMVAPYNSDEYDEYLIMKQLIAFYEVAWGFYRVKLTNPITTRQGGEDFLTEVKSHAAKVQFPNVMFNSGLFKNIPVFATPDELILIVTPDVEANISVRTLANTFNIAEADIKQRIVLVDELPIPDTYAILTTKDFFRCHDTLIDTTSIFNPKTLATNYFVHHWGIYAASPFVPAIAFGTGEATSRGKVTVAVTGLTVSAKEVSIKAGETTEIIATLKGNVTPTGKDIVMPPAACTYSVSVIRDTKAITSSRTYVDSKSVLHTDKDKLEAGDKIIIGCKASYVNPDGKTTAYKSDVTVTIA